MVWSSHQFRYGYVCSNCGSNRDTGRRLFIVNAPAGSGLDVGGEPSPCTSTEYFCLKRQLQERNSQREHLCLRIKDLTENTKKYKEHLEHRESTQRQQVHSLEKTHTAQLADRDRLIASLQAVVQDHEATIQQLDQRTYGSSALPTPTSTVSTDPVSSPSVSNATAAATSNASVPVSSARNAGGATARLISDIRLLHEEKSQLMSQLTDVQGQVEVCELEHGQKIAELQKALAEREAALKLSEENKENLEQAGANRDAAGSCSTDTEKQLEKVLAERERLANEVSSLHRFYTRNPTLSFSPQAEKLRLLEDENEGLRGQLFSCRSQLQQRETEWGEKEREMGESMQRLQADQERAQGQLSHLQARMSSVKEHQSSWHRTESTLREEISSAQAEQVHTARQLRDLQTKWTALQAKDPDVITKIVQVEVQSEDLKTRTTELERQLADLEQRCKDKDNNVADLHRQLEILSDKLKKGDEEKRILKECHQDELAKEQQSKELAVSDARRHAEARLYDLQVSQQQVRLMAVRLQSAVDGLRHAYGVLEGQARQFPQSVGVLVTEMRQQMMKAVQNLDTENKDLVRKYLKEMKLRKRYHNELVELKGNIRVLCRVRPPIREDGTGPQADSVVTYDPDDDGLIYVSNKGRIQTFDFDKVFSDTSTQLEVFEEVKALVTSCIDGFNVCIFAYGQTGSGKTFTMEGPSDDPGINQRALQELFAETADKGRDWCFSIEVSVLEIYNETILDLLDSDSGNKLDVKMKAEGGGYHVPGLVTKIVTSLEEVNEVFAEGRKNRATASTNMNEHSSRSHCLLCVMVSGVNPTTGSRSFGRLNLVDLAGSERVSKSGADGARLKEAQNINRSLSCLGDVIHALRAKQSHIPYRNSKLTFLLQDSLGGDSKTLMIIQVAPVEKNVSETTCSLTFGQRVRTVELGAATRRIELMDTETKSPTSPTAVSSPSSPPLKRKVPTTLAVGGATPRSPTASTPRNTRFTPSKSSPAHSSSSSSSRLLRQNSRK